jgi:hypothetical protein
MKAGETVNAGGTNGNSANTAAFHALNDSFVKMLEHNRSICERMMLAMQEESLRFVNLRLERTSKAIQDSRDCHGLTGLIGVQHDWLVDAARDYAEESRRFSDVMRDIAAEGASGLAEAASQAERAAQVSAEQLAA